MGDGATCHYCRKYNCICDDKADRPVRFVVTASFVPGGWTREVADAIGLWMAVADGIDASPTGEVVIKEK